MGGLQAIHYWDLAAALAGTLLIAIMIWTVDRF
jgi:hypothetical protein